MKKIIYIFLFFNFILKAEPQKSKLVIEIYNIRNQKGYILLGIVDESNKFAFPNQVEKFYYRANGEIDKGTSKFIVEIPYGIYAITVFHDENDNKIFDTSLFMGIPKEGFGFSNDAKGKMGPPSFDQAKFKVDSPNQKIKIKMNYLF